MIATLLWIHLLALSALFVEILLVRIFDTIVGANASYTIVTLAVLGGSLAGLTIAIRPDWLPRLGSPGGRARVAMAAALAVLLIYPALQELPFSIERVPEAPVGQLLAFSLLFVALGLPFFLIGLGIAAALSTAARPHWIYGADLVGAALGAAVVCPLLPRFGPVGEIVAGAGLLLLAASLPRRELRRRLPTAVLALIFVTTSAAGVFRDLDLASHAEKRGARETRLRAEAEFRRWDPVSKIEVVDVTAHDSTGATVRGTRRKLISYDGGSQSSHIYPFDGDYRALRARLPEATIEHFWQRGVLAAHYLFRDRSPRTLVIGCAGGQEVKAALVYGARHVDAIDLVETVVELGSRQYADYNGGIFLDPRVHYFQAEARAYLAAGPEAYDIIQIFSYHNSARLASGGGAVKAYYLETAEALALFLSHLSDQGVLQINQAIYPRVLVTLGQAMQSVGWSDPARHVVVYARDGIEDHATILVSRKPWDAASLFPLDSLLLPVVPSEGRVYRRVIDPLDPGASFLPPALWAEGATARASSLRARAPYRLDPVTDDRPFAYFLRKKLGRIAQDSTRFVDRSIARLVNQPGSGGWLLPRDLAHLVIIALVGLGVVLAVLAAPRRKLRSSPAWPRAPVLGYFACLGIGFLVLELTLVQLGLVPIGVPIQAYATTIGTLLVGAGIGSLCSARFVTKEGWAFALLLAAGVFVALGHAGVWSAIQGMALPIRIGAVALVLFPLGFAMGLPFPLGLRALRSAQGGAIAWAYAVNAATTALGGAIAAAGALFYGLRATLWIGLGFYVVASGLFWVWRRRIAVLTEDGNA